MSKIQTITIRRPSDMHTHLRTGKLLRTVVGHTFDVFSSAVPMGNTRPPKRTGAQASDYHDYIMCHGGLDSFDSHPVINMIMTDDTSPSMIDSGYKHRVVMVKTMPIGTSTNSQYGVRDIRSMAHVYERMQELDIVASFHGELPDYPLLDRERRFFETAAPWLVKTFPNMRIVFEHLSTAEGVQFVQEASANISATITCHHMATDWTEVFKPDMAVRNPHLLCAPCCQTSKDRLSLIHFATSGNPKGFYGSDSAPHWKWRKESANPPSGIFTPGQVALPVLAGIFEQEDALDKLDQFVSQNGPTFYKLPGFNGYKMKLAKEDWRVPEEYDGIVPFMAGQLLPWQIQGLVRDYEDEIPSRAGEGQYQHGPSGEYIRPY